MEEHGKILFNRNLRRINNVYFNSDTFIICGILLLIKTKKMPKEQGLHIITGIGAIVLIILGVILTYCILSGKIVLPLH